MTGVVFDIRELTVHDGPGLRTTVFLKGCPLRCAWCHNPEGLSPNPQILRSAAGERVAGRNYTSVELATILNRQAPLLRENGGVTFSGGEPLMQAAFVADTIDRLEELHVTLDTSGYAPEQDFRRGGSPVRPGFVRPEADGRGGPPPLDRRRTTNRFCATSPRWPRWERRSPSACRWCPA